MTTHCSPLLSIQFPQQRVLEAIGSCMSVMTASNCCSFAGPHGFGEGHQQIQPDSPSLSKVK
jgi:hypothetical protein